MNSHSDNTRWQKRPEGGQRWIMALYVRFALAAGRTAARLILPLVAGWFFLVRAEERRASRQFLARATGKPVTGYAVLKHFLRFAQVVLDRVYLLNPGESPVDLETEGLSHLDAGLAQGRGCLMMGSHLGSFEACRLIKETRPDVPLRILMDRKLNPNATSFLEMFNPELASQVIELSNQPGENILKIRDALQAGGLVALLADRAVGSEALTEVEFLGHPALLPQSPFLLAGVTRVPVVLFFGLYEGGRRYRVVFEPFAPDQLDLPRGDRSESIAKWAQAFADRLAHHAVAYPYNWFNFFPFWKS